jgi:hypothetical protein
MFLTRDELREMTGKQQYRSQAKVLNAMGITHKIRPDGTLLVLRSHVIEQLGGRAALKKAEPEFVPNWDAAVAESSSRLPPRAAKGRARDKNS